MKASQETEFEVSERFVPVNGSKFSGRSSTIPISSSPGKTKISSPGLLNKGSPLRHSHSHIMAGDIHRVVEQRKPRKTWATVDRSVLNVHLLKANLAEDGCEEAQLDVAKKLLEDSDDITASEAMQQENAKKAIYWLIKSAEQGNEEATDLLKQCLKTGKGITCQNIGDVKSCVETPKEEKLVFKAAHRLYDKLNNGEEFITTTQIHGYQPPRKESEILGRASNDDDPANKTFTVFDEDESADNDPQKEANGVDGIEGEVLLKEEEHKRIIKHEGVKLTRADLLEIAKVYTCGNVPNISISGKIQVLQDYHTVLYYTSIFLLQLLLLSIFLKALTVHSVLLVVLSWSVVVTCLKLLAWPKKLAIFHEWTSAFQSVLQNNSPDDFSNEMKMSSHQLQPIYLVSLISLGLLYLLAAPSELTFVLALVSICGVILSSSRRCWSWQTMFMAITTISACPGLSSAYFHVLEFMEEQIENSGLVSMETIRNNDCIKFIQTMDFQMAVVVMNLGIIAESYLHSRKFLDVIERLVLYAWFLRLIASSLALTSSGINVCMGATFVVAVALYLVQSRKETWKVVVGTTFAAIIVAFIALTCVIYCQDRELNEGMVPNPIFWEEYKTNCHRRAWEVKTVPETRIECWKMYERNPSPISWAGKITGIKVINIHDISRHPDEFDVSFDILVNLDGFLKEEGSSWQNLITGNSKDKEILSIASLVISTKNVIGAELKRGALKHLLSLRVGDIIRFQGSLVNEAGGLKPVVQVKSLRCIDCKTPENVEITFLQDSVIMSLLSPFEKYIGSQPVFLLLEVENGIRNCLKSVKVYYKDLQELLFQ